MIADSEPSLGRGGSRLKVKPVFGLVVLLSVACVVLIRATALPASPPGVRRLQGDVTKVVSVTGVVHPSPKGPVLKAAKGRYALAGRDLSGYVGQQVVVSGTVQTFPAEKGPRRVLSVTRVEPVEEKKMEPDQTSP